MPRTAAGSRPADRATARSLAVRTTRRASRGAFVTHELSRALAGSRLSPADRSHLTDLVYGALRHRIWLDAALAPRLRDPGALPEEVREALRLGTYEKLIRGTPVHAAVGAWVDEVRAVAPGLAGLANAVLRRVEAPTDPDPATRASLPGWLWRRLETALGSDAAEAASAMRTPAPLWLTAYAPDAAERLAAEGAEVEPGPLPGTLRVRPRRPLAETEAFRNGAVQPQNPASTAVTDALELPVAEDGGAPVRVLDLCAGRGVKTARLAATGAEVVAVELDPARIAASRANLRRLRLEARHLQADLRTPPNELPSAPYVLLDAPCSGTGTLRGHPEIVLRLREEHLSELTRTQDALLDAAVDRTEPGGRLVYAVCALTLDEGPERIAALRARRPEVVPDPWTPPLPHRTVGDGAFLLPRDGSDGFYVARLRVAR